MVEVSFKKIYDPKNPNSPPLNVDKRYVVLRRSSGFYSYGIFEHLKGWPDPSLGDARIAIKLSKSLFNFMAIADDRQRQMPTEEDRINGQVLDYVEAVKLTNPSNPRFKDEVDDKYQYSDEMRNIKVHGWISDKPHMGFWVISPSYEYCNGGPVKQDLTSHVGPTSLAIFFRGHYAGPDLGVSLTNGEGWTKVFGPVFFYVNSDSSNDHIILWEDAKRKMNEETNKWPYNFPASPEYLHADQRGSVSGQLLVNDWYINKDAFPAKSTYIGLANPGDVGSWQSDTKGYQFWIQTDELGNFMINNVRPGIYGLYSWVPGVLGEYKFSSYVEVTPGSETALGQIIFEAIRNGPPLWEIGFPDRSAAEFFIPDPLPGFENHLYTNTTVHKFRQYGLWDRYSDLYPNGDLIYKVGVSDFRKDWFFAHVNSICAEISKIDPEEKIGEMRLRRYLIRGLKKEYGPFVTSIQRWPQQPCVEELENMFSNQEALTKQMAKNLETDDVLFSNEKSNKKNTSTWNKNNEEETTTEKGGNSHNNKKCYRCGKIGHIKKKHRVKLSKANVMCTNDGDEQMKWEQCFSIEAVEQKSAQNFINYANNNKREEWIVDSRCSHHVTRDDSLFLEIREHHGDRVIITADNSTYPVAKEGVVRIEVADDKSKSIKLQDVYHVPCLKKNLVSVPQITNSRKYVLFGPTDVKVLEKVNEISADIIFTGERKVSLFVMSTGEAYVKKTSQTDSAAIWHARLGHVGYQILQQISSRNLVDGMPTLKNVCEDVICQGFQYGKSHRFFFQKNSSSNDLSKYSSENGVAERKLAYLTSVCLSWLHDKNLPRELWAEAIQCGCHVTNRLLPWPGTQKSPFELLYSQKPNVNYFRVFGSTCYVHVPRNNRTKLDLKARKCVFVGYDSYRKGCRCMDPKTNRFTISRDMVFDETSSLFSCQKLVVLGALTTEEPLSYEEAKGCPHWERAMQEEIDALEKNETWELVPKPEKCNPVTCKWVFRLKKKSNGTIDRFKARLVARGFSQNYGLDYEETFSPVAKMVTVRSLISLTAFKSWKLWQLDIQNAFLYGELDRVVFMEQPYGFAYKQFPSFSTGSAVVSWCSKKQDVVSFSTTEAEYIAATIAAQECIWLRRLINDMYQKVDYAVQIKCDNESAIKLASNPVFHARTKHIEIRHHFVREKVLSEEIELTTVRTNAQVADIFTKALEKFKFHYFRDTLEVVHHELALRGSVTN
ncbi:putative receptor-like cytosolic serine/threonine-protein kinase RBK1-like [Capsicum annuum]|nr:putative receptor-like cytosolic serine/threonine-protein kinase RBK1-like [Capsicum annuum]